MLSNRVKEIEPDILEIKSQDYPSFVHNKLVEDLQPYLDKDNFNIDDFYGSMIKLTKVKNHLAAIPSLAVMPAVYYNKTLFDKEDIPYPEEGWAWDEFEDIARKLTKKGENGRITQYGCFVPTDDLYYLEAFALSNGGSFLSPNGKSSIGYLDSQNTIEAIERFVGLFRKQRLSPYRIRTLDFPKVAMHCMTSVLVPFIKQNQKNIGVVGLPKFKKEVSFIAVRGFGISSKSRHKDLAWEFLSEFILPYGSIGKEWTKWQMSTSKSLAKESGQKDDPIWQPFYRALNHIQESSFLKNGKWEELRPHYNEKILSMIKDERSVQEIIKEWARAVQNKLESES